MNFFKHKLDISKARLLSKTIVFKEATLADEFTDPLKKYQAHYYSLDSFRPIANKLFLKSLLKSSVIENPNNTELHKEFICNDMTITYDALASKLDFEHKAPEDENQIVEIAKGIIEFARLVPSINQVGIAYEMFLEEDINIKNYFLKDSLKEEFTTLSIDLKYELDENTDIILTIATATDDYNKKGIYFKAHFHSEITGENSLSVILNKKFREIANKKINFILRDIKIINNFA